MIATVVISVILAAAIAAIIRNLLKMKKEGRSTCGGDCKHCGGACHMLNK